MAKNSKCKRDIGAFPFHLPLLLFFAHVAQGCSFFSPTFNVNKCGPIPGAMVIKAIP